MTVGPFSSTAFKYLHAGFSPIPIPLGQKGPKLFGWTQYCDAPVSQELLTEWVRKYQNHNIGIALGTKVQVGGVMRQIVALDIDDEELMPAILAALPGLGPTKRGRKGLTIFGVCSIEIGSKKFKRQKALNPSVELLAHGAQTVVPPSIHPEGMEYAWLDRSLLDTNIETWPFYNDAVLDEIALICQGKGDHFEALNTMVWLGVGRGGNTHDVCVASVAFLVARGWSSAAITDRIVRAKRDSVERAGEVYNWPQSDARIGEWIASAHAKGYGRGLGEGAEHARRAPPERLMAEWALATLGGPGAVRTVQGHLRAYRDGHWPEVDIPALLRSMYAFDMSLRKRDAENAVALLATLTETRQFGQTPGLEPRDDPRRQRVCLLNGTLNLRTGVLEAWSPDHALIHQIDTIWDASAECPLYDNVVKTTLNGDDIAIETWDEFCALTLVDDMTFQKVLFLRGPGGNGKGTLSRVLRNLHPPQAIGSIAVTDLNDERKRTSLVGKFVNISGEQSRLNTVADTYLKKITGGDPVDVRRLYGETQNNVVLSVRFIELVNEMPTTNDASHALHRRLLLLDCPNKIKNPDLDLDRKLRLEKSGILRRYVIALNRLYTRGTFRISEVAIKEIDDYLVENDPVAYWMTQRLEDVPNIAQGMLSAELWADFRLWSTDMGYQRVVPEVIWGRKLTGYGYPSIPHTLPGHSTNRRVRKLRLKHGLQGPL
jgi:P4 family phage/plasmid primase-like protien